MNRATDPLTRALEASLGHPATSPDFDLHQAVNQVLADVGMTVEECGGTLTFYGRDPILPSRIRFGTMAAIGLAARSVAVAALWQQTTGEGQDISVDVRKALRRFCGFYERKWETINGRGPTLGSLGLSPFINGPFFRETRDSRYVVAHDFYPQLRARTLQFLRCTESTEAIDMPSSNGAATNWKRRRARPDWYWPWYVAMRSFDESVSTPRSSQGCR